MKPFEEWCRAVEKTTIGHVALSNMRYDATYGRVERAKRSAFREHLLAMRAARPTVRADGIIQRVARQDPSYYFCQGTKVDYQPCSRIVSDLDFVNENVDLEACGGWAV